MLNNLKNIGYMSYEKAVKYIEKNKEVYKKFISNCLAMPPSKMLEARVVMEEQIVQNLLNYNFKKKDE
ncbi:hypothetical protein KAI04_00330 [Candidatus Pacearchaeota archaeon]|nr:hypothetical protein [Candidatus Pacearchaeota archaeon]